MLSAADADLVRRDPALPGLATLLDPDAFVAALRPFIHEADFGVSIAYVRYKPGTSCLVAYQFHVSGTAVDVYAKAGRPESWEKFHKNQQQVSSRGLLGPGRIVLDDCAIAVSIFPNDSELRGLVDLAEAEARRRLLPKLLPSRPDLWEGTLRRLAYKPERRYVAQLRAANESLAVLKVYSDQGYQAARHGAKYFRARGPLRLRQRLGRSNLHRILAFEWLSGLLLSDAIAADSKLSLDSVPTVGAAVAELHSQDPKRLARLTRGAEAAAILALADGVGFVCPRLAQRADRFARRLAGYFAESPSVSRPIHGDFHAGQVLLADVSVIILDLDRAVRGDPAADLGQFIAHLERDALRGNLSPQRTERLRDVLLDGYSVATRRPIPARTELYTAAGLFRLALEPFRYREPDWPERTEAILDRAAALLKSVSQGS